MPEGKAAHRYNPRSPIRGRGSGGLVFRAEMVKKEKWMEEEEEKEGSSDSE